MKMFIWNNPYRVDYGGSVLYVVAETENEARQEAMRGIRRRYGISEDKPPPYVKELGPPDFVRECPCAEWYEWSE